MTNERARARALRMNEYDRNIVSLLSKLFRDEAVVLRKKKIVSCFKVWFRCLDASLQRPPGPCMSTARLFCLRALEGL